ncbi:hypothetical protein [Emticicia soli]|uniref:Uncharacterized protein n=1 Tax=Emticicia soli TaxID=2027878 RepID=A0ABW5J413_9BACT
MKKLFTAYLLSITVPLCAQTLTGRVEGQVNNDSKKLVEFANVTLHREKYSKLIKDTLLTSNAAALLVALLWCRSTIVLENQQ